MGSAISHRGFGASINVSELADGTDGELITWNTSGVAATVAVGMAGEILISNGVGSVPTFQGSGWGDYTATWAGLTVGNGTVVARYAQIEKLVVVLVNITFGSTTSISAAVDVSLPVTSASGYDTQTPIGVCASIDATGSEYQGSPILASTTIARARVATASGTNLTAADLSSTVPFTWTTSDQILFNLTYEAAVA